MPGGGGQSEEGVALYDHRAGAVIGHYGNAPLPDATERFRAVGPSAPYCASTSRRRGNRIPDRVARRGGLIELRLRQIRVDLAHQAEAVPYVFLLNQFAVGEAEEAVVGDFHEIARCRNFAQRSFVRTSE